MVLEGDSEGLGGECEVLQSDYEVPKAIWDVAFASRRDLSDLRSVGKGGCNIGPSGTVFVQRNL